MSSTEDYSSTYSYGYSDYGYSTYGGYTTLTGDTGTTTAGTTTTGDGAFAEATETDTEGTTSTADDEGDSDDGTSSSGGGDDDGRTVSRVETSKMNASRPNDEVSWAFAGGGDEPEVAMLVPYFPKEGAKPPIFLYAGKNRVGRTCEARLTHTSVSLQHAMITINKDGVCSLKDMSRNGTAVGRLAVGRNNMAQNRIKGVVEIQDRSWITMGAVHCQILFLRKPDANTASNSRVNITDPKWALAWLAPFTAMSVVGVPTSWPFFALLGCFFLFHVAAVLFMLSAKSCLRTRRARRRIKARMDGEEDTAEAAGFAGRDDALPPIKKKACATAATLALAVLAALVVVAFASLVMILRPARYGPCAEGPCVTDDIIAYYPAAPARPSTAVFFYPGEMVDSGAYLPLLSRIANDAGVIVVLPTYVHLKLAYLQPDAAKRAFELLPDVQEWFIGGHSMGALAAARFVEANLDSESPRIAGLVLWAGTAAGSDLSSATLPVLSLSASLDSIVTPDNVEKEADRLPSTSVFEQIEGGVHEFFGDYRTSPVDVVADAEAPTVTRKDQQDWIVNRTAAFLASSLAP